MHTEQGIVTEAQLGPSFAVLYDVYLSKMCYNNRLTRSRKVRRNVYVKLGEYYQYAYAVVLSFGQFVILIMLTTAMNGTVGVNWFIFCGKTGKIL